MIQLIFLPRARTCLQVNSPGWHRQGLSRVHHSEWLFLLLFTESSCARSCFFILCPTEYFHFLRRRELVEFVERGLPHSLSSKLILSEDFQTRQVRLAMMRGLSHWRNYLFFEECRARRVHIMPAFPVGAVRVQGFRLQFERAPFFVR